MSFCSTHSLQGQGSSERVEVNLPRCCSQVVLQKVPKIGEVSPASERYSIAFFQLLPVKVHVLLCKSV